MGLLKQVETDQEISIRARCLIGRHPGCDLRLDDPRVSSEHSSVHWTGERWEIRDLGSRNGTTVDGNRLPAATDFPAKLVVDWVRVYKAGFIPDNILSRKLVRSSPGGKRLLIGTPGGLEVVSGMEAGPAEKLPTVFVNALGRMVFVRPGATPAESQR